MNTDIYQYPPELFNLLVDTIPLMCRSKDTVVSFFRGAGVPDQLTRDLSEQIRTDRSSINKFAITRTVLTRLNEDSDGMLRQRREVLKRVVEFENFASCWPEDQLKAKGLVAEIRQVINVKDSFTRINIERQREKDERARSQRLELEKLQQRREILTNIRNELYSLFGMTNAQQRGILLEGLLNRLFEASGIQIREAFTRVGTGGEGIIEQIDGVIELNGEIYLVEMKWWAEPLGNSEVSQHLVRVFSRGNARGILISSSGFTEPAVTICREALSQLTVVLCTLEEIVWILEQERDLAAVLRAKVQAAVIDKSPLNRSW